MPEPLPEVDGDIEAIAWQYDETSVPSPTTEDRASGRVARGWQTGAWLVQERGHPALPL